VKAGNEILFNVFRDRRVLNLGLKSMNIIIYSILWVYIIGMLLVLVPLWWKEKRKKIAYKRQLKRQKEWEENAKRLPISCYAKVNREKCQQWLKAQSRKTIDDLYDVIEEYNSEDARAIASELADRKNNGKEAFRSSNIFGTDLYFGVRVGTDGVPYCYSEPVCRILNYQKRHEK